MNIAMTMELRSHAALIKESGWFILLITVLAGGAGLVFSIVRPVSTTTVVSFDVQFVNRPKSDDYQYGTYYEQKASEIFVQNLMSSLMTPAVVEQILTAADLPASVDNLARATNRFKTKQLSAQNFSVSFREYHPETALKLSAAVTTVIEKRADILGVLNETPVFRVHGLPPVTATNDVPMWATIIGGLFAGFLASLVLVYLRAYFNE